VKLSLTTAPAAAVEHSSLAIPVLNADGTFMGTFTPTRFSAENGVLVAKGILNGGLDGDAAVIERITLPVTAAEGEGATLRLTLGPADVTLLGVRTHLEAAPFTIDGRPGLHVDLVCAVIQLFDSGPGLALIPDVLNQILART
jgi:hypothetical protein